MTLVVMDAVLLYGPDSMGIVPSNKNWPAESHSFWAPPQQHTTSLSTFATASRSQMRYATTSAVATTTNIVRNKDIRLPGSFTSSHCHRHCKKNQTTLRPPPTLTLSVLSLSGANIVSNAHTQDHVTNTPSATVLNHQHIRNSHLGPCHQHSIFHCYQH